MRLAERKVFVGWDIRRRFSGIYFVQAMDGSKEKEVQNSFREDDVEYFFDNVKDPNYERIVEFI